MGQPLKLNVAAYLGHRQIQNTTEIRQLASQECSRPRSPPILLRPTLFQGREVNVAVETQSRLTVGITVVDWWEVTGRAPNVRLINTVDADGFYDLLTERLGHLP